MSSRIRKKLLLLLFVGLWLALAVVAFSTIGWAHSRSRAVDMTPTATVTLTVTPTSLPTALALITITVRPSATGVLVGELLTVSVHIDYAPRECTFAMYDLTLRQPFSDTAWFRFLSPARLGPPAPMDAAFALQALNPGRVSLTAELYGEEYCGFWQWSYRYGHSPTILITPSMTSTMIYYVPWINR